jgi:hypothetical protein
MSQSMLILLHSTESNNFEIFAVDLHGNRTLLAFLHSTDLKVAREIANQVARNHHLTSFTEDR